MTDDTTYGPCPECGARRVGGHYSWCSRKQQAERQHAEGCVRERARICCGCGANVSQSQSHSQGCREAAKPESQRETRAACPGEA